ncbi:MAG: hypothetical protein V7785_13905 [Bermanella sp.]
MKNFKKSVIASTISTLALSMTMTTQAQSFDELIKESNLDINFRYRAESVDVDNGTTDSALANTLKSRLTFKSAEIEGLSLLVEGDSTLHISDEFYDKDGVNTDNKDTVLDQETTQLNQAYLQYNGFGSTIKAGNQRINLDNQRHVGGVGFRQDEATFDAVSITNKSIDNTTIFLATANNRNSITNTNTKEDINLLNVKYAISKGLSASAYYYGIDDMGQENSGVDFDTFGLRTAGSIGGILLEAELATQDKTTATADTTSLYYNVSIGQKISGVTAKLGYEVFGSDDGEAAFATPLGTNHKFFGWTDKFLGGAGNNGIQDVNFSAVTKVSGVKLVAQLHKFDAVEGSGDLGSEMGFLVAKKFGDFGASLKVAQYFSTEETGDIDITKLWLTGTAKF